MEKIAPIIIFFGHPGSGKGTQARQLFRGFAFFYLETGDLFRREIQKKTPLGKKIVPYMTSGRLVPADLVARVVESIVLKNRTRIARTGAVFDGFPRNISDVNSLRRILKKARLTNPVVVVNLKTRDEALRQRLLRRGRPDDIPDLIEERFREYHRVTAPAVPVLRKLVKVIDIDGNPPIPVVARSIEKALKPYTP